MIRSYFKVACICVASAGALNFVSGMYGFQGFGVSNAYAQSAVSVQGNQRIDADTIRSYVVSGNAGATKQALLESGHFKDVNVTQSGGQLVIQVTEKPIVTRLRFEGNDRLKDDILEKSVSTKARQALTASNLQDDVDTIKQLYNKVGLEDVTVSPEIKSLGSGRVEIVYSITEGGKVSVGEIIFTGNEAYSTFRLKRIIRTEESGLFSFLSSDDVYDPDRIEADKALLKQFYSKRGYADFDVLSVNAVFDEKDKSYTITYSLDEGDQYEFGQIDFDSTIPGVEVDPLYSLLELRSGEVFNGEKIAESIENISIQVAGYGHPFVDVTTRVRKNDDDATVDVTFLVDEGARVYIERIDIIGNITTRDYVVRREFDLAEGDAMNVALVRKAKKRLEKTQFFESVQITDSAGSTPDKRVLTVTVKEASTSNIGVGGGYGTNDGFSGSLTFSDKNFLGRGQFISAEATFGENKKAYSLSVLEPYFMGRRVSVGFDVNHLKQDAVEDANYNRTETGGRIKAIVKLTDAFSITGYYGLKYREIDVIDSSTLSVALASSEGESYTSYAGLTFRYLDLDNYTLPTDGIAARLNVEVAGLGGDIDYVSSSFDARYYRELGFDTGIVGMVRAQGGYITQISNDDVAAIDTFFQGSQLVRGFTSSGIGPRDNSTGDSVGGKYYYGATAEIEYPIPYLSEAIGIRGLVFADAGTLRDVGKVNGATVNDEDVLRSSVGAGAVWNSPFGLLRFGYAKALEKAEHDKTQSFDFGIVKRF